MKYSEVRETVYRMYSGKCSICGKKLQLVEMCINRKNPPSKGGGKDFSNMQCTCETCSRMKGSLTQEEFYKKVFEVARHNALKHFKGFLHLNRKEHKNSKINSMLKEYRKRTESIKSGMDWEDYFNLIEIANKTNPNNAVDLAFRLGHMKGKEDLKHYLLSQFGVEVE